MPFAHRLACLFCWHSHWLSHRFWPPRASAMLSPARPARGTAGALEAGVTPAALAPAPTGLAAANRPNVWLKSGAGALWAGLGAVVLAAAGSAAAAAARVAAG